MSIIEIIPLTNKPLTFKSMSEILNRPCFFVDENNNSLIMDESKDISSIPFFSVHTNSSESVYYINENKFSSFYISPIEWLEDNNVFELDIELIEKLWKKNSYKILDVSSIGEGYQSEDKFFLDLITILTDKYLGVISINEYTPNIPEKLYSLEKWRDLIKNL